MPKPSFAKEGAWIQTNSGRQVFFDAENIAGENIWLPDIAHALYNLQRFAGHLNSPGWTVGQHSMAMAIYYDLLDAKPLTILDALLHDAHEAYMGDMPAPFKWAVPEVARVQDKLQLDIMKAIGITDSKHVKEPWDSDKHQAKVDLMLCRAEAEMFFDTIRNRWTEELPAPDANIYKAIYRATGTRKHNFIRTCRLNADAAGIRSSITKRFGA